MGFFDLGASALLDTATNAIFNGIALKKQNELAKQNFEYQKGIDERNFEYEKNLQQQIFNREDTAYQRAVADAKAAGLSKGVVSSGAGSGAVLGTSSSSAQNNMDWSKLGGLATNLQQRKMNALSMKQMNAEYDISQQQKRLNTLQMEDMNNSMLSKYPWYGGFNEKGQIRWNRSMLEQLRSSQFDTLMLEQKQRRAAAQYYIDHPWLSDSINFGKSLLPIIPKLF